MAINVQLYQQQLDFLLADDHYLAMVAGLGSGKSVVGAVRALLATQGQIGSQRITTPNLGIVTAPTFPMLRDATIRTFLDIAGPAVAAAPPSCAMPASLLCRACARSCVTGSGS